MNHAHTITAITENSPGVLHRIVDLFTRRKVNIESLTVSETETKGISRFTIVVIAEKDIVKKIVKQVVRVIEVRDAFGCENRDLVFTEVALFKVSADLPEKRQQIEDVANRYNARVSFGDKDFLIVQKTGPEEEINSLYLLLEPFGMREFIRSGRIALLKHEREPGTVYVSANGD